MEQKYDFFAFISYNSKDLKWGKRVQRKLESYRMPSTLCSERGWKRKPMKPIFFAPTDIQPGGLTKEIQERLRASRHLIVICSPNSAKSEWVGKEIEYFHSLGRTENIHFFIVDGVPHSGNPDTECFNPKVTDLKIPEILGANINEKIYRWGWLNRERAYVQLISKLLGVKFDDIWQRHKRQLIRKAILWTIGFLAVITSLVGVWIMSQPFDSTFRLKETSFHNENLPPLKDAVVTLTLDNEIKTDTIKSLDDNIIFTNIPHNFLNKEAKVSVECKDFNRVDTTIILTKDIEVPINRNPQVYGNVAFGVWNPNTEQYLSNKTFEIAGQSVTSNDSGKVALFVPLEKQCSVYVIKNPPLPLTNDTIYMPSGESDVLLVK